MRPKRDKAGPAIAAERLPRPPLHAPEAPAKKKRSRVVRCRPVAPRIFVPDFRAWCPDEEGIDDGADYPSDVAECPEIAAALYAIHYARRWLSEPTTLTIAAYDGNVETNVRVDVDMPPRWRVRRAERIEP